MPTKAIRGIAASPGIAIGPIHHYEPQKLVARPRESSDSHYELAHLDSALEQARQEVQSLSERAQHSVSANEAAIFEAHEMLLNDPELLLQVRADIQEGTDAAYAWHSATQHYVQQLQKLNNEYLSARAVDMEDVAQRVLRILQGIQEQAIELPAPAIVAATDLTPSATIRFEREKVLAFCTATGGPTSHVAILAKALGIPAITSLGNKLEQLTNGLQVIVDGNSGEIVLEPDQAMLALYRERSQANDQNMQQAIASAHLPACTLDGKHYEIAANIGSPEQVSDALAFAAEGVGLLRTEFLFMDRAAAPDEEEQVKVYSAILTAMGEHPVVARTFDIGGDKPVSYLHMPTELNPFLGVRGIRLALARPDLFQVQLRALLRAGNKHSLRIMFPMVSSSEEIDAIRAQVEKARTSLKAEKHEIAEEVQIGIMIEVPAAALMADVLAEKVDFFSIGTNDLAQYTLAADRTNETTAPLADALHPAVLRLIYSVTRAAHRRKRWVGLCGELAGDPLATPVLLGLGLDELSMSPKAIPLCKQKIRLYSTREAKAIAQYAMKLHSASEVRAYLNKKSRAHPSASHLA